MPTFQVRNRVSRIVLGTVVVEDPEDVLAALAEDAGCDVDEIVHSLGKTVDAAKAALDIIEVQQGDPEYQPPVRGRKGGAALKKPSLPPRRLFG